MRRVHVDCASLGALTIASWLSFGCSDATECYNLGRVCPNQSTSSASSNGSGGDGPGSGGDAPGSGGDDHGSGGGSTGGMSSMPSSSNGGTSCPTGYECVPEGTTDHFIRLPGDNDTCGGTWSEEVAYAPPIQPGCNACSCDAPAGGVCSIEFGSYSDSSCNNLLTNFNATTFSCIELPNSIGTFIANSQVYQPGTCTPAGGGPAEFNTTMACGTNQTPDISCGADMVCVPTGSGELCNVVSDGQSCAQGYDLLDTLSPVQEDTRQCKCNCGPPGNPTCANASADLHNDNSCMSSQATISTDGQCAALLTMASWVGLQPGTWTAGSCPSITNPVGSVTFGPSEKLCCLAGG